MSDPLKETPDCELNRDSLPRLTTVPRDLYYHENKQLAALARTQAADIEQMTTRLVAASAKLTDAAAFLDRMASHLWQFHEPRDLAAASDDCRAMAERLRSTTKTPTALDPR